MTTITRVSARSVRLHSSSPRPRSGTTPMSAAGANPVAVIDRPGRTIAPELVRSRGTDEPGLSVAAVGRNRTAVRAMDSGSGDLARQLPISASKALCVSSGAIRARAGMDRTIAASGVGVGDLGDSDVEVVDLSAEALEHSDEGQGDRARSVALVTSDAVGGAARRAWSSAGDLRPHSSRLARRLRVASPITTPHDRPPENRSRNRGEIGRRNPVRHTATRMLHRCVGGRGPTGLRATTPAAPR